MPHVCYQCMRYKLTRIEDHQGCVIESCNDVGVSYDNNMIFFQHELVRMHCNHSICYF